MKKTGASLIVYALEQIGVKYTFGIPGVHNTELYDGLNQSEKIVPILVTHECGGAFMADAVSRVSGSIGTLAIVPAAGMTHALSGIGEAYLDGIPMLVISGGIRRDTGRHYQLHQIDQMKILEGITKKCMVIENHDEIIQKIYEAYEIATSGEPGPVFIEVPVNVQLFQGEISGMPAFTKKMSSLPKPDSEQIKKAAMLLKEAKNPGLFLGWGAREASKETLLLSEALSAPVSLTLQGLSVFPADHPLHTGMGFGIYSVPAGEIAFENCDALIAVGTRFSEIPTGSFGMKVPENLIHIDINPEVFDKNYKSKISITGDAKVVLQSLIEELKTIGTGLEKNKGIREKIRKSKEDYTKEWLSHNTKGRVNPAKFFNELRKHMKRDDILIADDGNHTFLSAELFPVYSPASYLSPTDFNCMGYCVPASLGAKLSFPEKRVAGICGDGAFLMTGMELLTGSVHSLGAVIFVFHDGELSQISQGQEIPYSRKTCSILGKISIEGVAIATGSAYIPMNTDEDISQAIEKAFTLADKGQPVIVDVNIDYSKRTRFTQGVVKINLGRFPIGEKFRFIGRALWRKIAG